MVDSMNSILAVFLDRSLDARAYLGILRANMDRYVELSPPSLRQLVVAMRRTVVDLDDAVIASGGDLSAAPVQAIFSAARDDRPPYDVFGARADPLRWYEATACPPA
jgi:hypothetical protein